MPPKSTTAPFVYTTLDNSDVKADLESRIAQWEREHYSNSLNLQTALATGDMDAAKTARDNMDINERTITEARATLASITGKATDPAKPIDVPATVDVPTDADQPA